MKRAALALLGGVLLAGFEALHSGGIVNTTRKNGFGCICHGFTPSDSVRVWIEGPGRVRAGDSAEFTLLLEGGPAVEGGFNVACDLGSLAAVDTFAQLISDELTHTRPRSFANDTVRWNFRYRAPAAPGVDSLYSTANSANASLDPSGDAWNFGETFRVDVTPDSATSAGELPGLPEGFALYQNFPNPFNPATTIRFDTPRSGRTDVRVYSAAGELVAELFRGELPAGSHELRWEARGLPSGVYLVTVRAGGGRETRKMLLIR